MARFQTFVTIQPSGETTFIPRLPLNAFSPVSPKRFRVALSVASVPN